MPQRRQHAAARLNLLVALSIAPIFGSAAAVWASGPRYGRPIPLGVCGSSLRTHCGCIIGTLGATVKDSTGAEYVLSNNHVLALYNTGQNGEAITQPECAAGSDAAAHLSGFMKLSTVGNNRVDAAIARVAARGVSADDRILNIGTVSSTTGCAINALVRKQGCATGLTSGRIVGCSEMLAVRDPCTGYTYIFENQIAALMTGRTSGSPPAGQQPAPSDEQLLAEGVVSKYGNGLMRIPGVWGVGARMGSGGHFYIKVSVEAGTPEIESAVPATLGDLPVVISVRPRPAMDGDSGALLVTQGTPRAVGLIFATEGSEAFANPIGKVLDDFDVAMAGPGTPLPAPRPTPSAEETEAEGVVDRDAGDLMKIPGVWGVGAYVRPDGHFYIKVSVEAVTPEVQTGVPSRLRGFPVVINVAPHPTFFGQRSRANTRQSK
jgi:hypothetical protein